MGSSQVHQDGCNGNEGVVSGILSTLLFLVSVALAFIFAAVKGKGVGVENMPAVSGH